MQMRCANSLSRKTLHAWLREATSKQVKHAQDPPVLADPAQGVREPDGAGAQAREDLVLLGHSACGLPSAPHTLGRENPHLPPAGLPAVGGRRWGGL